MSDAMVERGRRLGTALHQLARDLAEERHQNAALKRELERLRSQLGAGSSDAGGPRRRAASREKRISM